MNRILNDGRGFKSTINITLKRYRRTLINRRPVIYPSTVVMDGLPSIMEKHLVASSESQYISLTGPPPYPKPNRECSPVQTGRCSPVQLKIVWRSPTPVPTTQRRVQSCGGIVQCRPVESEIFGYSSVQIGALVDGTLEIL